MRNWIYFRPSHRGASLSLPTSHHSHIHLQPLLCIVLRKPPDAEQDPLHFHRYCVVEIMRRSRWRPYSLSLRWFQLLAVSLRIQMRQVTSNEGQLIRLFSSLVQLMNDPKYFFELTDEYQLVILIYYYLISKWANPKKCWCLLTKLGNWDSNQMQSLSVWTNLNHSWKAMGVENSFWILQRSTRTRNLTSGYVHVFFQALRDAGWTLSD